jgi:predicted Fe-S protein YdhL (DUF1289 family)
MLILRVSYLVYQKGQIMEMGIMNPCRGVCKIHEEYKICKGCYRSRLEIRQWLTSTDEEKLAIIAAIEQKREIYGRIDCAI